MKLNFDKEFMIKAVIVVIILSFFFSMFAMAFTGGNNDKNNDLPPPQEDYTFYIGQGNVALILKEYSGVIEMDRISETSKEFILEGVSEGDVLYFNEDLNKVSIVLSDKTKTYEYAKYLIEEDPTISIVLKARVYNDEKFDFTTDEGEVITASIPESEIRVAYPYKIGELLYYNALVQILDGNVVGAQLSPLMRIEEMEMLFLVDETSNEYYSRLFFNWRDRETARRYSEELNDTLTLQGAENVLVNYVSDITIYASRPLYTEEVDLMEEEFEGLMSVQMNKIIFMDNSTETEQEISDFLFNISNRTITLDFSPPMLEFMFVYDGEYVELEDSLNELNSLSIKTFYLNKAVVQSASNEMIKEDKIYAVSELKMTAFVPVNKKVGDLVSILVDAAIQANTIFEAEQVFDFSFE
jgi:hypothetical protein